MRAAKEGDIHVPARLPLVKDKLQFSSGHREAAAPAAAPMRAVIIQRARGRRSPRRASLDTKRERAAERRRHAVGDLHPGLAASGGDCSNPNRGQLENAYQPYLRCGGAAALTTTPRGDEPLCTRTCSTRR